MGDNQIVSKADLKKIRELADFDLIMLISEIHDHGWPVAVMTLQMMPPNGVTDPAELNKIARAKGIKRQP
jgi:hypothetical protein